MDENKDDGACGQGQVEIEDIGEKDKVELAEEQQDGEDKDTCIIGWIHGGEGCGHDRDDGWSEDVLMPRGWQIWGWSKAFATAQGLAFQVGCIRLQEVS